MLIVPPKTPPAKLSSPKAGIYCIVVSCLLFSWIPFVLEVSISLKVSSKLRRNNNHHLGDIYESDFQNPTSPLKKRKRIPYVGQIDQDLKPWKGKQNDGDGDRRHSGGITLDMLDRGENMLLGDGIVVRFHIRNNQIYASTPKDKWASTFNDMAKSLIYRWHGMLAQLQYTGCQEPLPDMDGLLAFSDGIPVLEMTHNNYYANTTKRPPVPLFGFQKKRKDPGILIPYVSYWRSDPEHFQVDSDKREDAEWDKKKDMMFWRGSTTGHLYTLDNWRTKQRSKAVLACRNDPVLHDICDAKFYNFAQMGNSTKTEMMDEIGGLGEKMTLLDQMQYKYLLALDGNGACAGRLEKFAAGTSLIVKPDSESIEFYYSGIKPNVHYLPVKEDLTNLRSQLVWAMDHQDEVQQMVQNMRAFSESIHQRTVSEYLRLLLVEYSKLIKWDLAPIEELQKERLVRPLYLKEKSNTHNLVGYNHTCTQPIYPCNEEQAAANGKFFKTPLVVLGEQGPATADMCTSPSSMKPASASVAETTVRGASKQEQGTQNSTTEWVQEGVESFEWAGVNSPSSGNETWG